MKTMNAMRWVSGLWFWAALAVSALGAKTTQTTAPGNWNDAIWDEGAPAAGDTVIVAHPIALTNATPALATYTLNAGVTHTLATTNALLRADDVVIEGILTHQVHSHDITTNAVGEWIVQHGINIACGNLTVASSGSINADGKGFPGANAANLPGKGPGGGSLRSIQYGRGAGHGGFGGIASEGGGIGLEGRIYGSARRPAMPGSGGSSGNNSSRLGGAGGGVVRIVAAQKIVLQGTISANGVVANGNGGGGSGGSVYASASVFEDASGTISAVGGSPANYGGAGAGGRVALSYGVRNDFGGNGDVAAGVSGISTYLARAGTFVVECRAVGNPEATGGDETYVIEEAGVKWQVHEFKTVGAHALTVARRGALQFLVVAGGGGGATVSGNHAGGGGGGGVLSNLDEDDFGVDAGTYSIIVGDGGLASQPGYASVFAGLTAVGGGAGGGSTMGLQGGSGGGGGAQNSVNVWAGGFPVAGQGRAGGKGVGYEAGGGGGGAGGPGGDAANPKIGGDGGPAVFLKITDTVKPYGAGGGGGQTKTGTPGVGGSEVGGNGATRSQPGSPGAVNTGSGGGGRGGDGALGGQGGSGIVIVRYVIPPRGTVITLR